jgi:hypothetical protein
MHTGKGKNMHRLFSLYIHEYLPRQKRPNILSWSLNFFNSHCLPAFFIVLIRTLANYHPFVRLPDRKYQAFFDEILQTRRVNSATVHVFRKDYTHHHYYYPSIIGFSILYPVNSIFKAISCKKFEFYLNNVLYNSNHRLYSFNK